MSVLPSWPWGVSAAQSMCRAPVCTSCGSGGPSCQPRITRDWAGKHLAGLGDTQLPASSSHWA